MSNRVLEYVIAESDGRLLDVMSGFSEEDARRQVKGDRLFLENTTDSGLDPSNDYWQVSSQSFRRKENFPDLEHTVVPDGAGYRITLTNLPVGSWVTWPDFEVTLENDGTLELVVDFPGLYGFIIDTPRFLLHRETINVDA